MIDNYKNRPLKNSYNCLDQRGISAFDALKNINLELEEDGLTSHDLGSYTTIKMLPEADVLIHQSIGKNMVNHHEYPRTTEIHHSMIKTMAHLLNAPNPDRIFGSSTTGSSESIFLAILDAKWQWKKRQTTGPPNIVLCSNAHLCCYKFARFLEIEIREIPLEEAHVYPMDHVLEHIDHNTVCVIATLGCTHLGTCDPIYELHEKIVRLNKKNDWNIGIHIDAAIGGFIKPFLKTSTSEPWGFALPLVRSINISGHKFGLVYPGLGWVLLRENNCLKSELSLPSYYLSGESKSFTVNFSRSSSLVIAQYFNFLHYGYDGYKKIIEECIYNAKILSQSLKKTGFFRIISDGCLPIVVFDFNQPHINKEEFTTLLRKRNWILPFYKLSGNINTTVMRIVVRHDITKVLLKQLESDLLECYKTLDTNLNRQ